MGGWIVTYIINVRGGGPSSGYISSGFFGGLALGRVGLLWVNRLVGERRAIFLYCILTMVYVTGHLVLRPGADVTPLFLRLEIVVWKVPSLVGNAVAVSFVGMFVSHPYLIEVWLVTRSSCSWVPSSQSLSTTRPRSFLIGSLRVSYALFAPYATQFCKAAGH